MNGTQPRSFNFDFREHFVKIVDFLKVYFRNPVHAMATLPEWEWSTLLLLQAAMAAVAGTLAGIFAASFSRIISGLILFPISSTLGLLVWAGFLFYTFSLVFHVQVSYLRLYTICVFASLPFFVLYIFSGLLAPISLVGFAVFSLLMIVGLTDNIAVERKKVTRLIGGLYLLYLIFWIVNQISISSERDQRKNLATPESYNILKEEFEKSKDN